MNWDYQQNIKDKYCRWCERFSMDEANYGKFNFKNKEHN